MSVLTRLGKRLGVIRADGRPFTAGQINPADDPPPQTRLRRLGHDLGLVYRPDGSWMPIYLRWIRFR